MEHWVTVLDNALAGLEWDREKVSALGRIAWLRPICGAFWRARRRGTLCCRQRSAWKRQEQT